MNLDDYLLRDVQPDEYMELKANSKGILLDVVESFDDNIIPKIIGYENSLTIRYNSKRSMVGIFEGEKLFIDHSDLKDKYEELVVQTFHKTLEKRLERIRMLNDDWFETMPEYENKDTKTEHDKPETKVEKSAYKNIEDEDSDNIPF
ncbi:MAG: hypothetical protein WC867_05940 [Candidatus Pacearchaeota archaeon]|jgi:hypothetical protein